MVSTNLKTYNVMCVLCRQDYVILAEEEDMVSWLSGKKYIQDALDYLSPAERELLISQTCDTCWSQLYGS